MQSSEPIRLFSEMCIKRIEGESNYESKDAVYAAYERFCTDLKLPKESSETFSRRLKETGLDYKQKKRDGVKFYAWQNIELRNYKEAEKDQERLEV